MHIEVRMPVSQQLTESTRTVESRSYYGKIDYIKYNFLLSREPIEMRKKTHPSLPWKFIFSCTSCDRKPDHMKTEKVTYLVKNKRYDAAKFSSSFSWHKKKLLNRQNRPHLLKMKNLGPNSLTFPKLFFTASMFIRCLWHLDLDHTSLNWEFLPSILAATTTKGAKKNKTNPYGLCDMYLGMWVGGRKVLMPNLSYSSFQGERDGKY